MKKIIANWVDWLVICVLVLAYGSPAVALPEDIMSTQNAELIERVKDGSYMQHTVKIPAMADGAATVCFRTAPNVIAQCFYKLYDNNEAVMVPTKIIGEIKT